MKKYGVGLFILCGNCVYIPTQSTTTAWTLYQFTVFFAQWTLFSKLHAFKVWSLLNSVHCAKNTVNWYKVQAVVVLCVGIYTQFPHKIKRLTPYLFMFINLGEKYFSKLVSKLHALFFLFFFKFFLSLISLLTVSKTNKLQPAIGLQL
jgi:hypothetical protein